jgi:phage recombination protein Bet
MSTVSSLSSLERLPLSPAAARRQIELVRRTVARGCTDAEFEEFIAVAALSGLDPMRRQIRPLILSPDDLSRRRMIPWTTIDGLRSIAARQGDYRPMETAPIIECDPALIDPRRNPAGIVRAEVRAWKYRDQTWFPVCGEAWWDEYAPLRPEKSGDAADAEGAAQEDLVLDRHWARMGRVMIAKCAEAQALRRGWPDNTAGLYSEEELYAAQISDRVTVAPEPAQPQQALWFLFDADRGLESVGRSDVFDRVGDYIDQMTSAEAIARFLERNRASLNTYWDWNAGTAFELKRRAERRIQAIAKGS